MWPLVFWLLLYPLSLPAADWITRQAGRERPADSPAILKASLALYLTVAVYLAIAPLL